MKFKSSKIGGAVSGPHCCTCKEENKEKSTRWQGHGVYTVRIFHFGIQGIGKGNAVFHVPKLRNKTYLQIYIAPFDKEGDCVLLGQSEHPYFLKT